MSYKVIIAISIGVLALHLGMLPNESVKDSEYKTVLKGMLKECIKTNGNDCNAIEHVLASAK